MVWGREWHLNYIHITSTSESSEVHGPKEVCKMQMQRKSCWKFLIILNIYICGFLFCMSKTINIFVCAYKNVLVEKVIYSTYPKMHLWVLLHTFVNFETDLTP